MWGLLLAEVILFFRVAIYPLAPAGQRTLPPPIDEFAVLPTDLVCDQPIPIVEPPERGPDTLCWADPLRPDRRCCTDLGDVLIDVPAGTFTVRVRTVMGEGSTITRIGSPSGASNQFILPDPSAPPVMTRVTITKKRP